MASVAVAALRAAVTAGLPCVSVAGGMLPAFCWTLAIAAADAAAAAAATAAAFC